MNTITFYLHLDLKKEGEDCGFPPNGTICHPDVTYGLCGEGLECYKLRDDCSAGICKKKPTGKTRFMISTCIKQESCNK